MLLRLLLYCLTPGGQELLWVRPPTSFQRLTRRKTDLWGTAVSAQPFPGYTGRVRWPGISAEFIDPRTARAMASSSMTSRQCRSADDGCAGNRTRLRTALRVRAEARTKFSRGT